MKVLLSKINYRRKRDLLMQTNVISDQKTLYVEKKAFGDKAWQNLIKTESFFVHYSKKLPPNIKIAKFLQKNTKEKTVKYEFIKGQTLRFRIESSLIERDFETACTLYEKLNDVTDNFITTAEGDQLNGFKKFTKDYNAKIPDGILKEIVPLTEFSHDHLIVNRDNAVTLIDYENFLEFYLPARFIKFRAELYMLLALQEIIRSLGSEQFVLKTYWKDLFIPKEWGKINNFSLEEKKFFLFVEEKLQNYLYDTISNMNSLNLMNYREEEVKTRMSQRLTVRSQQVIDGLKNSKIYLLWRTYRKLREYLR